MWNERAIHWLVMSLLTIGFVTGATVIGVAALLAWWWVL